MGRRQPVAFRIDEMHFGAARTLGQPDMAHGGKFEFAQHDLLTSRKLRALAMLLIPADALVITATSSGLA